MKGSFFSAYERIFAIIFILAIIFVPTIYATGIAKDENSGAKYYSDKFCWPIPGYTNISSPFGRRNSPTGGASSFHQGIDIPAPEGTKLYALDDATIIFASWGAGGGYTITGESLNFPEIKFSYCHCSPIFLVNKGDMVKKGNLIATVGPKNVYGIQNNQYKDSNGLPTNGATTGCHLHFALKVNNKNVNPLDYFQTLEYDNNEIIEKENKENEW